MSDIRKAIMARLGIAAKAEMAMDSRYKVGDTVVARVAAQGMKKGQTYKVTDISMQDTPWGTFFDYQLDGKLWVGNGHLVLDKVNASRFGKKEKFGNWFVSHTADLLRSAPYAAGEAKLQAKMLQAQAAQLEKYIAELKAIKAPGSSDPETRDRVIALHTAIDAAVSLFKREMPNRFSRAGIKAKMAVNRRKVVQDLEYLRDEARRINDASSRMDAENWLKRVKARDLKEQDWLEAADAVSQISAILNSRPGAKAQMAASISRGIDPKKGGQWITGTWDGGTWGALVFSEPSEAYGIPEFPHISKLYMNPKGMPGFGDVVVNYDRGWDVRPSTPETKKGYQEIAKAVTAAAKKAAASGWYSRPGAKAKMDKSAALAIVGKAIAGVPAGAQRDALQKALIDYYDNTQAAKRLLQQGNLKDATRFDGEAGRAAQIAVRTWDRLGKPAAELRGFTQNLERAAEFARPGAKAEMAAEGRVNVDGVEYRVLPYQVDYFKADLAKFDDPKWRKQIVQHYLKKNYIIRASRPGAKVANALSDACWSGYEAVGTKEQDGKTVPNCVPKATAAKPEVEETEEQKAGLKIMSATDQAVSDKIRTLIKEGKPQDQAVAIALDMKRRGEL
jgi:hypothetical protein